MATNNELMDLLEKSAKRSEDTSDAYYEVLTSEGEKDIQLSDGTTTPNLNKRIKELGGQVTSIAGKTGDVTITDISESLELGSAAKYNVSDLMIDSRLRTWSGRTQEDKNRDNISGSDLGVGDGKTNNSAAFSLFDSSNKNKVVDLLGGTYVVNSLPTKNTYKNGYFLVNETLKIPNGFYEDVPKFVAMTQNAMTDNVEYQDAKWLLVPDAARPAAQDNALQSIVFDEINGYAYTQQNTSSGGVEHAYISRYALRQNGENYTALDSMQITTLIGHQSMAVDYMGKLWGAGREAVAGAIRYSYVPNGAISDIQYFKLHPTLLMDVAISYDQKWLVAQANLNEKDTLVRVFDLKKVIESGGGDCSSMYSYEFTILDSWEGGAQYLQGLASDGYYLYFLNGRFTNKENTYVHIYTFDGRLVRSIRNFDIGVKDSLLAGNTYYEAETFGFTKLNQDDLYPTMIVGVALGNKTDGRTNKLYTVGYNTKHTKYVKSTVNRLVSGYLGVNTLTALTLGNTSNCAVSIQGLGRPEGSIGRVSWTASDSPLWANSDLYMRSSSGIRDVYVTPKTGDAIYRALGYTARNDGSSVESIGEYWLVDEGATDEITPIKKTWQMTDSRGAYGLRGQINGDGSIDVLPSTPALYSLKLNKIGTGFTQLWDRSSVLSGGIYLSEPRTHICALNGKDFAISTTPDTETSPIVQIVLSNNGSALYPYNSNKTSLGSASSVFSNAYLQNAPVIISDENYKTQITSLSDKERLVAQSIKPLIKKFKMKDAVSEKGKDARWHIGVIAQEVISAFNNQGLDPFDYGIVCYDEWEATNDHDAGSRYAIRYDELAMFILSSI